MEKYFFLRSLYSSDVERAKLSGTGKLGHCVIGHGQMRAMPVKNIFGTGINHRAMGTKRAFAKTLNTCILEAPRGSLRLPEALRSP